MFKLGKEELRKRTKILEASIWIEGLVSALLAALLDIDHRNSKTLGHKSSSLSLKNKIDLLTDMNSMNRDDAKKYELFMGIRNQFVHVHSANSFQNCFANLNGASNRLLKLYPQNTQLDIEQQLELGVTSLIVDLTNITINLVDKLREKIAKDVQPKIQKELLNKLLESVRETGNELGDEVELKILDKFEEKIKEINEEE